MLLAEQFTPKPLSTPNEHLAAEEIDTESSRVHIETEGSDIMDCVHSCSDRDESVVDRKSVVRERVFNWV